MPKIKWKSQMTPEEKRRAVETALFFGFQTTASEFPIVSECEGEEIPEFLSLLPEQYPLCLQNTLMNCSGKTSGGTGRQREHIAAIKQAKPIPGLEFRSETGLELLFSEGMFLKDTDYDLLPDKLDVKFMIPEEAGDEYWKAACDLAFRFGMETTAYEGNIVARAGETCTHAIVFRQADTCSIYQDPECRGRVILEGQGSELEAFVSLLCEHFPLLPGKKTWQDIMMEMTDSFAMRNLDGEVTAVEATMRASAGQGDARSEDQNTIEAYLSPEFKEYQKQYKDKYPQCDFFNYKSGKVVYEKEYDIPWETDMLEQLLEEKVYPYLKCRDRVTIFGALSEEKQVRENVVKKLTEEVKKKQAVPEQVNIICAYKQGFSWMEEVMLPKLKKENVKKVKILFKPFLPEGETIWQDENGATPSYHNLNTDNPDKWYDLPIRYLQELYPVADIIQEQLELSGEQILFDVYEGTEDITYLCSGEDERGVVLIEDAYKAACSERPFLNEYPQMGKVHPATGFVKVCINGVPVLEERIQTDLEQIWNLYQSDVLPDCRNYVEEKFGGQLSAEVQPFFSELRLEVTASEPDYRLNSREDLISSLDALHEDMYFVGADYFKNYGMKKANVILDAPGLILPVIHHKEGKPEFRVTLSEQLRSEAAVVCNGTVLHTPVNREGVNAKISKIAYQNGKLVIFTAAKAAEDMVQSYANLLEEGILEMSLRFTNVEKLVFETGEWQYEAKITEVMQPEKNLSINQVDLFEDRLIGYDECMEILEQLKRVPGIEVFQIASSYMGRKVYAIELLPKEKGYVSWTKRITKYPSEFINTRHHANEVSGTNGIFILLKKLLTEETYKNLSDQLNLVLVPMENVDGTAIHYELQKEHPYWKFHVARFNALGKEFYHEHFQKDTIHKEAMGLTRLYFKYLPDIMVDNHGVPSHEWEQQFSGYTSPSYKGFWLPRSLLYGYFWYVSEEVFKDNYMVNKAMEDVIAEAMAKDSEMTAWNKDWAAQFERYAHAWMPKLFPADYYKDMINYWIPFPHDMAHRYPSIRYPWITTVAYTSEVADETAQGAYLNLCARAHVAHDEATIQMLLTAEHVYDCTCVCSEDRIFARYTRLRPMIVSKPGKR